MTYEYKGNTATSSTSMPGYWAQSDPTPASVPASSTPSSAAGRSPAQVVAALFGAVFLLVAIAGFIPGVTSDYDGLALAGKDSTAELLGLFRVSILHNLVHALFGIGLLAAARATWARAYLLAAGAAYALVALFGLVVDAGSDANFIPVNDADNLLHVGLSLALLAAGVATLLSDRRRATA